MYPRSVLRRPVSSLAIALASLLVVGSASLAADPSPAAEPDPGSACWTSGAGTIGNIDRPTEATAVVLRMSVGGGFVPNEFAFMEAPTFTLYGNDVVIFRPSAEPDDFSDPLEAFACAALTADEVDDLLAVALDEGGLRDAQLDYPNPFIVDAPSTTFSIDADGVTKVVVVQALGIDSQAPDPEARARFKALADMLASFEDEVASSQAYQVPLYRTMLTPTWPEIDEAAMPWPWVASPVELFGDDLDGQATLAAEEVTLVASVPNGGQTFIALETPDGEPMNLTIRPLLPDET